MIPWKRSTISFVLYVLPSVFCQETETILYTPSFMQEGWSGGGRRRVPTKNDYWQKFRDVNAPVFWVMPVDHYHHATVILLLYSEPVAVIVEYVPHGDLRGFLRKSRGLQDSYFDDPETVPKSSLSPHQLFNFALDIAAGMEHLSSHKASSTETFGGNKLNERHLIEARHCTALQMFTWSLFLALADNSSRFSSQKRACWRERNL